jgi:hypothetical protein
VSAVSAPVSAVTQGVSAQTEKIDITFDPLLAGQAISVGGLSFTATRNVSDVEVANAFKGLVLGATTGVGTAYGTYTNALTGFTTSNLTGSKVTFSPSQNRTVSDQYASTLVGVSAEYQGTDSTSTDWKAIQVLGTPNTDTYGSSVTSWSLPMNDMVTPSDPQWITVGFTNAVHANGIEIRETHGNGFVTRIDLIDSSGKIYENVWQGVDPSKPGAPVNFKINFPITDYLVTAAKVYINTQISKDFEEIDSIRLFGYPSIISTTATTLPAETISAPIVALTEASQVEFSS